MALTEEQILELSRGQESGMDVSDDERREIARYVLARIEKTKPDEIEPGSKVVHPRNPISMIFVEYRGEKSLVKGFPDGVEIDELSEFEVPSDEIFVFEIAEVVVGIVISGSELKELYDGWEPPEPDDEIH